MVTTRMELERRKEIALRYRYSGLAFEANQLFDEIKNLSEELLKQIGIWIEQNKHIKAKNVQKAIKQLLNADVIITKFNRELEKCDEEMGEGIKNKKLSVIRGAINRLSLELNEVNRRVILNRIMELQKPWKKLNIKWNVLMDQLTEMEREVLGRREADMTFLKAKKLLAA